MTRLDNLYKYYEMNRRVGHTTLMLRGVQFDKPCVILFSSQRQAYEAFNDLRRENPDVHANRSDMLIGRMYFRSIEWLDKQYMSWKIPVIVDHWALQVLKHEHDEHWQDRVKEFQETIDDLRKE